jgi:hypothetical protein
MTRPLRRRVRRWGAVAVVVSLPSFTRLMGSQGVPPTPRITTADVDVDRVFAQYARGDYAAIEVAYTTPDSFPQTVERFSGQVRAWRRDWRPVRATFFLEMAIAARNAGSPTAVQVILSVGGTFVIQRPKVLGSDPREDAFEITWHKAAIGLLQGLGAVRPSFAVSQDRYLNALSKRYKGAGATPTSPFPGFDLDRAIARTQQCCTELAFDEFAAREDANPSVSRGMGYWGRYDASRLRSELSAAIHLFARAAGNGDSRSEGLVRGANLLLHAGQPAKAEELLKGMQAAADPFDRELLFWTYLVRAHVEDALTRPADAIPDHRNALNVWPGARSAEVRLAADLMRTGHRAEAVAVAAAASTGEHDVKDPWWAFDAGDDRFVTKWRDQLRKADW